MMPPATAAAAARPLPVLLDAAPGKGFAGAIGGLEELGAPAELETTAPVPDGKGAPVPEA